MNNSELSQDLQSNNQSGKIFAQERMPNSLRTNVKTNTIAALSPNNGAGRSLECLSPVQCGSTE
jgi:hypothetical protein